MGTEESNHGLIDYQTSMVTAIHHGNNYCYNNNVFIYFVDLHVHLLSEIDFQMGEIFIYRSLRLLLSLQPYLEHVTLLFICYYGNHLTVKGKPIDPGIDCWAEKKNLIIALFATAV